MNSSSTTLSLVIIIIVVFTVLSLSTATTTEPTAYEVLESYDFPVGLLPKGVTGYELNPDSGEFKVYLPQTCKFSIEGYDLEYKSTITGVITKGRLYNLKGVSVKVLFLWVSIVEVDKANGDLQFSVGIASANFPLEGFDESPQCGCGFDCDDDDVRLSSSLVSSS